MKLFDCCMYFDEYLMLDLRLNTLNEYVDKFVIAEATRDHSVNSNVLCCLRFVLTHEHVMLFTFCCFMLFTFKKTHERNLKRLTSKKKKWEKPDLANSTKKTMP